MRRGTLTATALQRRSAQNTPWKHMPFFLVTQTSLVEAQDEQEAAQTGVDRLRSGGQVTVAVKSMRQRSRTSWSLQGSNSRSLSRPPKPGSHRLLPLLFLKALPPNRQTGKSS